MRKKGRNHQIVLNQVILKGIIKERKRKSLGKDPDQIVRGQEVEVEAIIKINQSIKRRRNRKKKGGKKDKEAHQVVQVEGKKKGSISQKNKNPNRDLGQDKNQKTNQILKCNKRSRNKIVKSSLDQK